MCVCVCVCVLPCTAAITQGKLAAGGYPVVAAILGIGKAEKS